MKQLLIVIFSLFLHLAHSQNCGCSKKPELKNLISCQPTVFKNKAKYIGNTTAMLHGLRFKKGKFGVKYIRWIKRQWNLRPD